MLGICNGFQILTEAHLLPGSMIKNEALHVRLPRAGALGRERRHRLDPRLRAGPADHVPLKNQDGQFVADDRTLDMLEGEGRVVFRYQGRDPNGSRRGIAGI